MVSSSSDEGTQQLYAAAPDLVLPELRPYRTRGEIGSWIHDVSVVTRLESRQLVFRSDHASGGKVDAVWREAFLEFPDRFLVGTDTYTPERWFCVVEHAHWSREWLADLPREVAERIAWRSGDALFTAMRSRLRP